MPNPDRATKDAEAEVEKGKDETSNEPVTDGVADGVVDSADAIRDRLGPGNYSSIAREAKCSRQQVSRVLRGLSGVSMDLAKRIAQAAGVGLDDMFQFVEGVKDQPWVRCGKCGGSGRVVKE